jgi:GTP-binding protein
MNTSIIVSLIGRPNVGKSTIFNRLMQSQFMAITYDKPGVTRDRHYGSFSIDDVSALLVDTGGFYPTHIEASGNSLEEKNFNTFFNIMAEQAKIAIDESDLVILVVDGREGLNPFDQNIAEHIRRSKKDFWVVVNKIDTQKQDGHEVEFYNLGINEDQLLTLSAAHGRGFEDFKDKLKKTILEKHKENKAQKELEGIIPNSPLVANVAIIGAPNAGKSTLLNKLVGSNRALVSDIPGTTVDPIEGYFELYFGEDTQYLKPFKDLELEQALSETEAEAEAEIEAEAEVEGFEPTQNEVLEEIYPVGDLEYKVFEETIEEDPSKTIEAASTPDHQNFWRSIKLVDTAGIRKQKSVTGFIETQSVIRSLRAISDSDVIIFMVDATIGITHQDRRLCDIALEKGKSIILCLNKIDLLRMNFQDGKKRKEWIEDMRYKIPFLSFCDLITISAKRGSHINYLKSALIKTILIRHKKLGTGELNRAVTDLVDAHPIIIKNSRGRRFKVKYASMVKSAPPTILLFSNKSKNIPENYKRYLVNGLRNRFKIFNTPVHLIFRTGADLEKRLENMNQTTTN